ncbi:hypothetical protein SK128_000038 [Halocaridina rubra]|uniref:Uncharacterized protein n=1 Tax=Halocaridina rubra TaxID=373956 RepID=A0AAN8XU18_HALRR
MWTTRRHLASTSTLAACIPTNVDTAHAKLCPSIGAKYTYRQAVYINRGGELHAGLGLLALLVTGARVAAYKGTKFESNAFRNRKGKFVHNHAENQEWIVQASITLSPASSTAITNLSRFQSNSLLKSYIPTVRWFCCLKRRERLGSPSSSTSRYDFADLISAICPWIGLYYQPFPQLHSHRHQEGIFVGDHIARIYFE